MSEITYPYYLDDDDVSYVIVAVQELAASRSKMAKQLTDNTGAAIAARDAVALSALAQILRECPRIVLEKPTYTDS